MQSVAEGEILDGKYRIEKQLGAGGMGIVVAAHHVHLDERVALKFLHPEAVGSPDAVARFAREARAAVKIKSEHVARVIDVGALPSGAPYIVMEFLEGSDLNAWLRSRGALPIEQAVEFLLQACEAIADAHALGIVHRDLKPSNLFCIRGSDGLPSIKVLDFGISKLTSPAWAEAGGQITETGAVMGSPYYMSPEQMASARNVDARSDIWALGVILHELLTGVVPFKGRTLPEVCLEIANHPLTPPQSRRPDLPLRLAAVLEKCLQKRREDRYQNVAELALALAPFAPERARNSVERICRVIDAAGLGATSANPELAPRRDALGAEPTLASWGNTQSSNKRSRTIVLSGAGALVLMSIASVVFIALRARDASHSISWSPLVVASARGAPVASIAPSQSTAPAAVASVPPEPRADLVAPLASLTAPALTTARAPARAPAKALKVVKEPPAETATTRAEKWGGRQ